MMRKLICKSEARVTKAQHTSPCSDCPFRRDSIPGWLGGNTAEDFVMLAQGDASYPCHTLRPKDAAGWQCAGLATFRANICKSPRDPDVLRTRPNKTLVFSWPLEFMNHHRDA
jgi:hypothetical protein